MIVPDIFYVEDDQDFAFLMKYALKEVESKLTINIISEGNEALNFLIQMTEGHQRPRLILLDLNLPGLSGMDILKRIRDMPLMKYTPVILFTTSDNPKDIKASMEFGANAYVIKPIGYTNLITCLRSIYEFWFKTNAHLN